MEKIDEGKLNEQVKSFENKFEICNDLPKQEDNSLNMFQGFDEQMYLFEKSLDQLENKGYFKKGNINNQTNKMKYNRLQQHQHSQARQYEPRKRTVVTMDLLQQIKLLFQRKQQQNDIRLGQIGKMLALGYSTISNLYSQWKRDPYFLAKSANILQRDMNSSVCTVKRNQFLREILTQNPFLTQQQIIDKVNNNPQLVKNGKDVTRFTIHNTLKKLNFVKKLTSIIPKSNDSPQAQFHRNFLCRTIKPLWQERGKVHFFKIERLNIYTIRGRGWCPVNQKINMNAACTKTNNLIVVLIANKEGVLRMHIFPEGVTKKQLLKTIILMLKNAGLINNPENIMLTNERFLLSHEIQQIFGKIKLKSLKIPDHLLQLNPLDSFMREVKAKLRRIHFRHHQEMKKVLQTTITFPASRSLYKYIDYMIIYLQAQDL